MNIGAIANNSSLGELTLNIGREQRTDGKYDLKQLNGTMTLVSVISLNFSVANLTGEDFRAKYGDLSPELFAEQVRNNEIVPYCEAEGLVSEKINTVVRAFGYAGAAELEAAVRAQGYMAA